MKTGTHTDCWVPGCKQSMSSYGIAAHIRAHWRRKEITRDWIGDRLTGYYHYRLWKKGEKDGTSSSV